MSVIPPRPRLVPVRNAELNASRPVSERYGLGGEAVPSLAATVLDHGAPAPGPHANTEPVLAVASPNIRLVRALHEGSREERR